MTSYELSRNFWDFSFENTGKIKPIHVAIYFFAIEHCNRLGWKRNFGLPTSMVLEAISVKSYSVYKSAFDDLVEFDFFEVVQYSKNQYSSNIIALKDYCKANDKAPIKALDKAMTKHSVKQPSKQRQSNMSIDKPNNLITLEPINSENKFSKPTFEDVKIYCSERKNNVDPEKWIDHYTSNGWMVGKNKMKDWKAAVRTWEKSNNYSNAKTFNNNSIRNDNQSVASTVKVTTY